MVNHIKFKHSGTEEAEDLESKMEARKKTSLQMDSFMEDMIMQVGEKWQCKVCAKITRSRETLNRHVRKHALES